MRGFYAMIRQNLVRIKERIQQSCAKVRRYPQEITLVAVTKGRGSEQLQELVQAGIYDIGENKVQEALTKYIYRQAISLSLTSIRWHMLGHLQTNKVKDAVRIFDLIQSVDSLRLAGEINKQAAKINKIQDVLVEVNISAKQSKFGIRTDEALGLVARMDGLRNIRIKGLMGIAPSIDNPESARPYFRMLKELFVQINKSKIKNHKLQILSMGMSDDFEVAITEGATMIRLGRAVFQG